jgi:hypothetical protein
LHLWNTLAREYYRQKRFPDFVKILEAGINFKFKDYEGYDKDQMAAYDTLAAYFVQVPVQDDGTIPVVTQCCGSRMFILDPYLYRSDPGP